MGLAQTLLVFSLPRSPYPYHSWVPPSPSFCLLCCLRQGPAEHWGSLVLRRPRGASKISPSCPRAAHWWRLCVEYLDVGQICHVPTGTPQGTGGTWDLTWKPLVLSLSPSLPCSPLPADFSWEHFLCKVTASSKVLASESAPGSTQPMMEGKGERTHSISSLWAMQREHGLGVLEA